jgi:hypothetical protein
LNKIRTNFLYIFWHILGKIHVEAAFLMSFDPTKGLACMGKQHTLLPDAKKVIVRHEL